MYSRLFKTIWLIVACGLSYLIGVAVSMSNSTQVYSAFVVILWLCMVNYIYNAILDRTP